MGTRMMGAHGEGSGTRRLFKAYTLVGAAVLAASLAWLSLLATSADDGSDPGIVITVIDPAGSGSNTPEFLPGAGNPGKRCSDNQGSGQSWTEFKLEGRNLADGTYTSGPLTVTLRNFAEDSFDWESNIGVDAVIVKGGNAGSYLYRYDPPAEAMSDEGLSVPDPLNNSISHLSFCYDFPDATEPTPEPTPTPAPTAEPTPEPTPTPEPRS